MSFNQSIGKPARGRIEMADPDSFNDAQRSVYNKIVSGKRGKIVGPLRVALHSPELADRWQALGEFLRFQTDIPTLITELAIITTGRFWNSQVEWVIHARIAEESGLSVEIIEAIRTAQAPQFERPIEALVYDFTREVLEFGQASDDLYRNLHAQLGTAPLVELTAVIGYYSMVAMTLNVHQVPVPESETTRPLDFSDSTGLLRPTPLPKSMPVATKVRVPNG